MALSMQKFVTHTLYGMNEYGAAVTEVLPKGEPKHVYLASEVDPRIADLEKALRSGQCPYPIGDDHTVDECIKAGKCGCANKSLTER